MNSDDFDFDSKGYISFLEGGGLPPSLHNSNKQFSIQRKSDTVGCKHLNNTSNEYWNCVVAAFDKSISAAKALLPKCKAESSMRADLCERKVNRLIGVLMDKKRKALYKRESSLKPQVKGV